MGNKLLSLGLLLLLLTSCSKTYVEPDSILNQPQTDLSGTNWVMTRSPFIGVFVYDTIHFVTITQYTLSSDTIPRTYNVFTSYTNETLTFNSFQFWNSYNCSAILGLGFASNT